MVLQYIQTFGHLTVAVTESEFHTLDELTYAFDESDVSHTPSV
jgi:hypothetical protein